MPKWGEIYKGYLLICTPYNAPDGKFAPRLIIERHMGNAVELMRPIAVNGGPDYFDTEEAAANAARIAGRMWVDDNG